MAGFGISGMRDVLEAPRKHPVGVLVTHVPLFILWVAFAVGDITDGSIKARGGGYVSRDADPLLFYFVAAKIAAVAVVIAVRIAQATFALADARTD